MKRTLLLAAFCLYLVSCNVDEPKKDFSYISVTGDSIKIEAKSLTDSSLEETIIRLSTISYNMYQTINQHYISFREANQLITNYNFTFNDRFGAAGIGGCIPKSFIDGLPDPAADRVSGIVYYICYDNKGAGTADDQVYIAYRAVTDFDYGMAYFSTHFADADVFNVTTDRISKGFSSDEIRLMDTSFVRQYLEQPVAYATTAGGTTTWGVVRGLNSTFKTTITDCVNPLNSSAIVTCTAMACGFFEKSALQNIAAQMGIGDRRADGVRFYLGYDPTLNENKIRVVLMGASSYGNILYVNGGGAGNVYSNYIERSWP